ncbi:unnamed protein product [Symbiodinium sp. KB8]|nr:unnamed protein product [Symbiodinium sp. KB8]
MDIPVTFLMPEAAAKSLQEQIERGAEGISHIIESVSMVDVANAEAWKPEDETKVKSVIQGSVGFEQVNRHVVEVMVQWIGNVVKGQFQQRVHEARESRARGTNSLTQIQERKALDETGRHDVELAIWLGLKSDACTGEVSGFALGAFLKESKIRCCLFSLGLAAVSKSETAVCVLAQYLIAVFGRHPYGAGEVPPAVKGVAFIEGGSALVLSKPELRDVVQIIAYTEVIVGSVSSGMMLCSSATRLHGGHGASQPRRLGAVALGAFLIALSHADLFAVLRSPRTSRSLVARHAAQPTYKNPIDYKYELADEQDDTQSLTRDVVVNDIRDLNELLKLRDPICPDEENVLLMALTLDNGTRIERPTAEDLRMLKPSKLRPVVFHWRDASKDQTNAPKEYDEIIQRLLNSGPQDFEELVRANWKMFDRGFYFRLYNLREDCEDPQLKQKMQNLETYTLELIQKAQEQTRKKLPEQDADAQAILTTMLEEDGQTLLWPPPSEAYARLAEEISKRATRSKYEDGWFESVTTVCENFGAKMQARQEMQMLGMSQIVMQRLVTEWLRHDSIWEETAEGRFLFRLMSIAHEQWETQFMYEQDPVDPMKMREEIKIISETKVIRLPMGSKLQIYAAKYLQGLLEFIDKTIDKKGEVVDVQAN